MPVSGTTTLPSQRFGGTCDLYSPGHQIHYTHQGDAVRSRSLPVGRVTLEGSRVVLVLDDGVELHWRHHDPARLHRILEAIPTKRVIYPEYHALRVGPYWFNCARESDWWQNCRTARDQAAETGAALDA